MHNAVAVIMMGQSPEKPESNDVYRTLSEKFDTRMMGLLDGMDDAAIDALRPHGNEMFIVSTIRSGRGVQIAEREAMRLTREKLVEAERGGASAALILCTGHFEIPEQLKIPVFTPERIIFALFNSLNIKKLGVILPEEGQKCSALTYYASFSPVVLAASPYGGRERIAEAAGELAQSGADIILADCMGFTSELGALIAKESQKQVFVPRVVLPQLIMATLN